MQQNYGTRIYDEYVELEPDALKDFARELVEESICNRVNIVESSERGLTALLTSTTGIAILRSNMVMLSAGSGGDLNCMSPKTRVEALQLDKDAHPSKNARLYTFVDKYDQLVSHCWKIYTSAMKARIIITRMQPSSPSFDNTLRAKGCFGRDCSFASKRSSLWR